MVSCLVQIGDLIRRTKDAPYRELEPTDPLYPELLPPRWYMSDGEIGGPVVDELSHLNPSSAMRMPPTYTPEEVANFDFTGQDTSLWGNGITPGTRWARDGRRCSSVGGHDVPEHRFGVQQPRRGGQEPLGCKCVRVDGIRPLLSWSECHDG